MEIKQKQNVAIKTEERETADDNTDTDREKPITIRVLGQTAEDLHDFILKKSTKMSKVFKTYAAIKGLEVESLRFILDGENINGSIETPSSLRLEDGDQIDAILAQCGC